MLTRTSRVALNALSNYARFAILMGVLFFLTPYIIGKVGRDDFGLWTLSFSVLGFFGLLDLGFATGVVKFVAECKGSADPARRNRLVSTFGAVYCVLGLVGMACVIAFSLVYPRTFAIPTAQSDKAVTILWILGVRAVLLEIPLSMFRGILFGEQRIALLNLIQVASTLAYAGATWVVLGRGGGLVALAWINLGVMLLEHAAYIVVAYRVVEKLRITWAAVDRRALRETASFSVYQFLINISGIVLVRTDPIIIKLFLPLSAVALYAVATRIAENAFQLTKQFVNVLAPLVAELKSRGEEEKLRFVFVNCAKFAFAAAAVLAVAMYALGREAIVLWVGSEFSGAAPALWILMTAFALATPGETAASLLAYTGEHRVAARASLTSVAVNVTVSVALVPLLGLVGVAAGTLVAILVVDWGIIVRTACPLYGVSVASYFRRAILPVLGPAVLQFAVTYAVKSRWPVSSLSMVALEAVPGLLLFAGAFLALSVEPSERAFIRERLFRSGRPGRAAG
jgi:O-antigen/teichoic acid export membrane protein